MSKILDAIKLVLLLVIAFYLFKWFDRKDYNTVMRYMPWEWGKSGKGGKCSISLDCTSAAPACCSGKCAASCA